MGKRTDGSGLTEQQKRFCDSLLADPSENGTKAYESHYSAKGKAAEASASRLLSNAKVQEYLALRRADLRKRVEIEQEQVVDQIARLAFSDIRKAVSWGPGGVTLMPSNEIDADTAAAIAEVSEGKDGVKIKFHSKDPSLDKLAKKLGIYAPEKHEHSHTFADLDDEQLDEAIDKMMGGK